MARKDIKGSLISGAPKEAEKPTIPKKALVKIPPENEISSPENEHARSPVSFLEDKPDVAIGDEDDMPLCPLAGCTLAFLERCAAEWTDMEDGSGRIFSEPELSHSLSSLSESSMSLPGRRKSITMGTVCNEIIKPRTMIARAGDPANDPGKNLKAKDKDSKNRSKRLSSILQSFAGHGHNSGTAAQNADKIENDDTELLSFAELALRENLLDSRGRPAFAKATHFVSHAWRYIFGPFVEAVVNWVNVNGIDQDSTYFWVDAFVVNQHKSQNYPQKWWSTRFMQAVGEIGNTILVLEPWDDPVPFKRAWVIWEMYCTSVTGARLHITMRPESMDDFNETLVTSFEKVQSALSNIDVSSCEAFHKTDQDMIHNEIKRTIGFTRLNEMIQTRLVQWLTEKARSRINALTEEEISNAAKPDISRFKLADNLARMLRESGNVNEARDSFEALLSEVTEKLGYNDFFTLGCMNQLAVTYQKMGQNLQAMRMHRKCLEHRVQVLGTQHADSLQSTSNLAVLISSQKPLTQEAFEEARHLFQQAIIGREAGSGPSHPSTLYTISNTGKLLSHAPIPSEQLFQEADTLHQRAVDGLVEKLRATHPLSLTAMHNQASHWLALAQFRQYHDNVSELLTRSAEQLQMVHTSRTEKLGKQHPDTLSTKEVLDQCTRLRNRFMGIVRTYATWAELSIEEFHEPNTYQQFFEMRKRVRDYGVDKVRSELVEIGFVDGATGKLTVGMQPFNIWARIGSGVQTQPTMVQEQAKLGKFQDRYVVACNRPESDEMWNSSEPAWLGKASMSKRHRFLVIKNLHWEWFNVLTFGLVSGLDKALVILKDMKEAARTWVRAQDDWSDQVGMFLHVHSHSSVLSLHLHIVDMDCLGPSWGHLHYKNLSIDDAIAVIEAEVQEAEATAKTEMQRPVTKATEAVPHQGRTSTEASDRGRCWFPKGFLACCSVKSEDDEDGDAPAEKSSEKVSDVNGELIEKRLVTMSQTFPQDI